MLTIVFAQLRAFATNHRAEATRRRKVTSIDPVADTIDFIATDLLELVDRLERETEYLTPESFAEMHDTTPQTVRAWIRAKRIQGTWTKDGWKIASSQIPPKTRRHRIAS